MNRKLLRQFVAESFGKDGFDKKKVEEVAKSLSRKNLKVFINELKVYEKEMTVYVYTALPLSKKDVYIKELETLFPDKKIEFRVDPSLIMGVRVVEKDNVFEFNMNNLLNKIENHVVGGI